jgi:hypothetical protein
MVAMSVANVPPPADSFATQRLAAVRAALEALGGVFRVARALAESQRSVDLHGIDDMAGQVCAHLLDLPPAEGRTLRPLLPRLLAEAEALQAALQPVAAEPAAAPSPPKGPHQPCPPH